MPDGCGVVDSFYEMIAAFHVVDLHILNVYTISTYIYIKGSKRSVAKPRRWIAKEREGERRKTYRRKKNVERETERETIELRKIVITHSLTSQFCRSVVLDIPFTKENL